MPLVHLIVGCYVPTSVAVHWVCKVYIKVRTMHIADFWHPIMMETKLPTIATCFGVFAIFSIESQDDTDLLVPWFVY